MNQKLASHQKIAQKRQKPFMVWLVLFSFLGPAILAFYFYSTGFLKGAPLKLQGILLNPPISLHNFLNEKSVNFSKIQKNKWKLLYVHKAACSSNCEQRLYFLKQIHIATGRDASRVQHIFMTSMPPSAIQQKRLNEFNFLIITNISLSFLNNFLSSGVYIVDPMNQAVLFYDETVPPKNILTDLRHLLKFSNIG